MSADRDLEGRVRADAERAVASLGLLIDDLSISRAGKRSVVRIAVDDDLSGVPTGDETSLVPPVTLDAVADATRAIDAALEESDLLGQSPYLLEVTSPGTSSPLTRPRHYRRNVGRLVRLTLHDGSQAGGRVVAAGPAQVTIQPETSGEKGRSAAATPPLRSLPYADIAKAGVQVEFSRTDDETGIGPDDRGATGDTSDASDEPHDDQED